MKSQNNRKIAPETQSNKMSNQWNIGDITKPPCKERSLKSANKLKSAQAAETRRTIGKRSESWKSSRKSPKRRTMSRAIIPMKKLSQLID